MAVRGENIYGTFGSVAEPTAETGTGGQPDRAQATPEAYGAGVGQVIQDGAKQAINIIQQYQGMQNETLATNADAKLSEQIGAIKGKYKALSGQEAVDALPATIKQLNDAFTSNRANLPLMAARGFDMMAKRNLGYAMGEVNEYGASQFRAAKNNSAAFGLSNAALNAGTSGTANNPEQFANTVGDIKYLSSMTLDENHPGFAKNDDGEITGFKDDANGQELQGTLKNTQEFWIGKAYTNKFNTLGNEDPIKAWDTYLSDYDQIPAQARADIGAQLLPQVNYAKSSQLSSAAITDSLAGHQAITTNPANFGVNNYNLGNVKTKEGSATNTQQFVQFNNPVDGAVYTANTLRGAQYQGLTLRQIADKWTSTDQSAWLNNVSKVSGISPDTVPNLNDPTVLKNMLEGIATAEKSPAQRAAFTDEVLNEAAQKSLSGEQVTPSAEPTEPKPYATDAAGNQYDLAAYYADHREQILEGVMQNAQKQFPGNLDVQRQAVALTRQRMDEVISDTAARKYQDKEYVMKGLSGQLSDGKPPATLNDLMAMPGMKDVLRRVPAEDIRFYQALPKLIEQSNKMQTENSVKNTDNGYDAIVNVLTGNDGNPIGFYRESRLHSLLTRSDTTAISLKDYQDARGGLGISQDISQAMAGYMQQIETANGNVDGQGKIRAIRWYNEVINALQRNKARGEKAVPEQTVIKELPMDISAYMPSRQQQINNMSSKGGMIRVMSPDGKTTGSIPASQLAEALQAGYTELR